MIFNSIFDQSYIELNAIINIIINLKDIISYAVFLLLFFIGFVIIFIISLAFVWHPYLNSGFMITFLDGLLRNLMSSWFYFSDGPVSSGWEIPGRLIAQLLAILDDIYMFMFQYFFLLIVIYFVRSIFQKEPSNNFKVVRYLVLLIIFPLFIEAIIEMLAIFGIQFPFLENLHNPLDSSILVSPSNDFFTFITSPIFLLAIALYIYLDISFQINYVNLVSKPSLERSERLENQLELLHKESLSITTYVDQIKEESKKKKEELGIEQKEKISTFMGKKDQKFSYVKEMIQKKKLEEEEKKLLTAARDTRMLGSYLERLFREDPTSRDTLTAATSAPKPSRLVLSTVISFVLRITALIFIGYLILHTAWLITDVFYLPIAISESVALYSPEIILVVMVPVILIFPVVAQLISFVKKRALISQLSEEEEIKQIEATVGDYLIAPTEEEEEKEEETEGVAENGEFTLT